MKLAKGKTEMEPRAHSIDLDQLIGIKFPVLDDGFIRVMDYMGTDDSIVQAARVSYGKGTKSVRADRGLIRYLMRHRHTTPFEMCEIKLHVRVPMDCWRQWIRHRTANVNEYSTRYSEAIDARQTTKPDAWRKQSNVNKQGSDEFLDQNASGNFLTNQEKRLHMDMEAAYRERLIEGVAREQARKDLPLSTYTEAYWKIDLHNLFHFLKLRMDSHAQLEIRIYADVISKIVSAWCPLAWGAFYDYQLDTITFSSIEKQFVKLVTQEDYAGAKAFAMKLGWMTPEGKNIHFGKDIPREYKEFEAKLIDFGFIVPWGLVERGINPQDED